jgi:hypothetical protein
MLRFPVDRRDCGRRRPPSKLRISTGSSRIRENSDGAGGGGAASYPELSRILRRATSKLRRQPRPAPSVELSRIPPQRVNTPNVKAARLPSTPRGSIRGNRNAPPLSRLGPSRRVVPPVDRLASVRKGRPAGRRGMNPANRTSVLGIGKFAPSALPLTTFRPRIRVDSKSCDDFPSTFVC